MKSHQALVKKANKDPEAVSLAKQSFESMESQGFIIKTSKLPFGTGKNDGLQTDILTNKNIHFTPKTLVKKMSSTSTKLSMHQVLLLKTGFHLMISSWEEFPNILWSKL